MTLELDPEFKKLLGGLETLESCAQDHEGKQIGGEKGICNSHRCYLAAMAVSHLMLGLDDLGEIARYLHEMEIEGEEGLADDAPEDDDSILDEGHIC